MKVLADTCVIIDVLQKREPFWEDAAEIFRMAATGNANICITAKSTADIYYLMHRVTHSDIEIGKTMKKIFLLFPVLDTAGLDCQRALISETADYEDAIMVETALHENVDCIITRNISDYKFSPVPVYTPSDFLNITKRQ